MKKLLLIFFSFSFLFTCAQNNFTSSIDSCNEFVIGPNSTWTHVLVATTIADGASSQAAQTFTMNVTSLPAGGANVRVYKTTANGNDFFGNPVALTLGSNSITVPAVTFDRAVKFQFSSGDVEFDALSLNGVDTECVCISTTSTDLIQACDNYTWIDGNTYTTSNNTATYTLVSTLGCDSIVTLDLTITTVDASVMVISDSSLQAQLLDAGTSYQWVDCNNNFAVISGETNSIFSTQNSGDYAVEVTINDCSALSDCYNIYNNVNVDFFNTTSTIQLFPNPAKNDLTISIEGIEYVDVVIFDIHGKVMLQQSRLIDLDHINLSSLAAGAYFVKIISSDESKIVRIAKY
mgnify:CR=1 FL=1